MEINGMRKVTDVDEFDPGNGKDYGLGVPYDLMAEKLGEPFISTGRDDENYPDDPYKTDVCWNFVGPYGSVSIWNYKNGPAYTGEGTIHDIDHFSVSASEAGYEWLCGVLGR